MAASPIFSFGYPTPIPLSPRSHNTPSGRTYDSSPVPFGKATPAPFNRSMFCRQSLFSMPPTPPVTPPNDAFKIEQGSRHSSRRASPATDGHSVSQRRQVSNPLTRSTIEQRQQQKREAFLEGVRDRRSDRLLEGRGDRLLHLDYLTQRRQWEREQAASAPNLDIDSIENEDDPMVLSGHQTDIFPTYSIPTYANQQADIAFGHTAADTQYLHVHSQHTPSQPMVNPTAQHTLSADQSPSHPDDDAALAEVIEAESRELEYLIHTHETISDVHNGPLASSALYPQHSAHRDDEMQIPPSSPLLWGSDDGDDAFEGELWRLGDAVDGHAPVEYNHDDMMDMS